ncbi:MAG: hypothetical protein JXA90_09450 [Planctomycetes bacterium]|nr:hypothetical protein [Planctomycetota bacterium]
MNRSAGWLFFAALAFAFLISARAPAVDFVRGDANGDGQVTFADAHKILSSLFLSGLDVQCGDALDADNDGQVMIRDAIYVLRYRVLGDAPPPAPFPQPGIDDSDADEADEWWPCDSYGDGTPVEDPQAAIEVLDSVAPGGGDRSATIVLGMSNSYRLAGYSAELDLGGIGGRYEQTPDGLFDLTGAYYEPGFLAALTDDSTGHLNVGFLANFVNSIYIPARETRLALEVRICLKPGTSAGDYPITLVGAEMAEHFTGRRIEPTLTAGTLTILEDIAESECVLDAPGPTTQSTELLDVLFELGDTSASPGSEVLVPFIVSMSDHACGTGARFSVDFDEEVLRLVDIETVIERPDGQPLYREDSYIDNEDSIPGSSGLEEGFATGRYTYSSWSTEPLVCLPVNDQFTLLNFRFQVRPDAAIQVSEVRFVDGGEYYDWHMGELRYRQYDNSLSVGQTSLPPELVHSFVFVNGRVDIVPDVTVFIRGDASADNAVEMSDAISILGFLFLGSRRPACFDAADANDDGRIDVSDPIAILQFLYLGGEPLPAPQGTPGEDPTDDEMTCARMGA